MVIRSDGTKGSSRFEVRERLGGGGMGEVFVAFDRERGQTVALKTLRQIDPRAIFQFKREFRTLADLSHPNLVGLYDLVNEGELWFFTMELVDGLDFLSYVRGRTERDPEDQDLDESSEAKTGELAPGSLSASELSSRAIESPPERVSEPARLERLWPALRQLANGLHALHKTGHLHRDIKPSNVMVTREGRVVLLDFGIITEIAGQRSSFRNVAVAGTPAYMAPEQVREEYVPTPASDWYALGVLLFEALAGYPPFRGDTTTILEAKRVCEPPDVGSIVRTAPDGLVALCRELMRPDPRSRPSGEEILRILGEGGAAVDPAHDPAVTFVGREAELAQLRQALARAVAGEGGALLLRGVSGVGKSALMEHFLSEVYGRGDVVVLAGRCFESESVPYKALDSLVDSLYHHYHAKPREWIAARLPADAGALASAFPILQQIEAFANAVGAAGASLQGSELQRRAFAALLGLLSRLSQDSALVLYIDDLQWGDMDSLPLVLGLMRKSQRRILLVAAYRAEEEQKSLVLRGLRDRLATAGEEFAVTEVALAPLPSDAVERLVGAMLGASGALVQTIVREANGHPYLAHELARYAGSHGNALDESAMSLDRVIGARLAQLSEPAQSLLCVVALAGFPLTNVIAQAAAQLGPGHRGAFSELRAGRFVRSSGTRATDLLQPYHDRIRETLVAQLAPQVAQRLHLRIAQALEGSEGRTEQTLYPLAHHYFHAQSAEHAQRTFELNREAAQVVARSHAYAQAYLFLEQAARTAEQNALALPIDFLQFHGDVSARTGRADQAAEIYGRGLAQAKLPMERVKLRMGLARLSLTQLDTREARLRAVAALNEMGLVAPRRGLKPVVGSLLALRRGMKRLHDPTQLGSAQGEERARTQQLVEIYNLIAYTAYFEMDNLTMLHSLLRMTGPVALLGHTRELANWHLLLGVTCAVVNKRAWALHNSDRAIVISREIPDRAAEARAHEFRAHSLNLLGEPRQAETSMRACLDGSGHLLENADFLTAVADYAWISMMRGYAERGWGAIADGLERVRADSRSKLTEGHTYRCYAGPLLAQLGRAEQGAAHLDRFKQFLDTTPPEPWRTASYWSHRILFCALVADDEGLEQALAVHAGLPLAPGRARLQLRQAYVGQAMARVRQIEESSDATRPAALKRATKALADLKKAGAHPSLRAHYHVLAARLHRIREDRREAAAELVLAAALAEAHDSPWVLYEVAMERARLALVAGRDQESSGQLAVAARLAATNGWKPRLAEVSRLRGLLPPRE